ncbi:MAG TPA: BglG family transcription antiterminator [Tetragenococcus sp.]|nr:BglG family transcription antiterminator [Tetragenococcus sp.]
MYFSDREKKLLKLLLENQKGVLAETLQRELQISKRTLYREISSIEKTIDPLKARIVKVRNAGYQLIGQTDALAEISDQVQNQATVVFDNVHRQSALVCQLLLSDEEVTIESLALDFTVSPATIYADLDQVEKSLTEYQLHLERKKARGVIVKGAENKRRQILSNIIYSDVNEYDFFSFLTNLQNLNQLVKSSDFFLQLIDPLWFYYAKNAVLNKTSTFFVEVTDNQLQQVITSLALSLQRMAQKHYLAEKSIERPSDEGIENLAIQILTDIQQETHLGINYDEIWFFAKQLEGVNYKKPQNVLLDNFDTALSYQIRELIRQVSKQIGIDFRLDDTLFYDLLNHLSAAFKRMDNQTALSGNPLLEKILVEYQKLTTVIRKNLTDIFPDESFIEDELAYIVIHFAAALERNPVPKEIAVLVLCSSGIGTAKILESRIQKYIPEIDHVEIAKISQMSHLDFKEYDLILSTIFLPEFSLPYKMISPLLLDDEVFEIKQQLKDKSFVSKSEVTVTASPPAKKPLSFEKAYEQMKVANELLTQFSIQEVMTCQTLEQTMQVILDQLEGLIITDAKAVNELVIKRHKLAPIGIPNTHFALFHSANAFVKKAYFGIFNLSRSVPILGMDQKPMELTRMLLMLAPQEMTEGEERLLGQISASIIENDVNMKIYQHGNREEIYQVISTLFMNEIKEEE